MASQKDVQDLLRILTTGRNKLPMMTAMGRVKALQAAGLRRYSPPPTSQQLLTTPQYIGHSLLHHPNPNNRPLRRKSRQIPPRSLQNSPQIAPLPRLKTQRRHLPLLHLQTLEIRLLPRLRPANPPRTRSVTAITAAVSRRRGDFDMHGLHEPRAAGAGVRGAVVEVYDAGAAVEQ